MKTIHRAKHIEEYRKGYWEAVAIAQNPETGRIEKDLAENAARRFAKWIDEAGETLEPVGPDASTDATLGDALDERAEAVEAHAIDPNVALDSALHIMGVIAEESNNRAARIAQLEAELAQVKARLAQIDLAGLACFELTVTQLSEDEYQRLWGIRLEQLYTAVITSQESHS